MQTQSLPRQLAGLNLNTYTRLETLSVFCYRVDFGCMLRVLLMLVCETDSVHSYTFVTYSEFS